MKQKVVTRAPINIALCKYWGKREEDKVLPSTESISLTLDGLYTQTSIEQKENGGFVFYLDGIKQEGEELDKIVRFCSLFDPNILKKNIQIRSLNHVPTGAGLASSASGFAALSLALNVFYEHRYSFEELVAITRQGSGSAVRSLLEGFVSWSRDGKIKSIASSPKDLRVLAVVVDEHKKHISSRQAMAIGVKTSSFYPTFVKENQVLAQKMKEALDPFDFERVGRLMEKSTSLMHKVMLTSHPKVDYQQTRSKELLALTQNLREKQVKVYATMDAGPNVKLFVEKENVKILENLLLQHGFDHYFLLKAGKKAEVIYCE